MRTHCSKACGVCGGGEEKEREEKETQCNDSSSDCQSKLHLCKRSVGFGGFERVLKCVFQSYGSLMRRKCAKSCDYC
jgi:hypothetical protein